MFANLENKTDFMIFFGLSNGEKVEGGEEILKNSEYQRKLWQQIKQSSRMVCYFDVR